MIRRTGCLLTLIASAAVCQVAIVSDVQQSDIVRAASRLPLAARRGDLLYPGDRLLSTRGSAVVRICPGSDELTLRGDWALEISGGRPIVRRGQAGSAKGGFPCELPSFDPGKPGNVRFFGSRISRAGGQDLPTSQQEIDKLDAETKRQLLSELQTVDLVLKELPDDVAAHITRASILARYNLHAAAAIAYDEVALKVPELDWPRQLVHLEGEQHKRGMDGPTGSSEPGKTYALLVGISEYKRLPAQNQLRYAHRDASLLNTYLASERGGGLAQDNIKLLTNQNATSAAIRNGITTFLQARAGKRDTVILFLAAHGVVDESGAFIVTHDSDPDDLVTTALRMEEIQRLLDEQFAQVGRVLLYVDVCRAGTIASVRRNNIGRLVEVLARQNAETFGILASAPGEYSFENERFGGGHGAFSYFLARGLNGEADDDRDGKVSSGELFDYVRDRVREATRKRQTPRDTGNMARTEILTPNLAMPGIELAGWRNLEDILALSRKLDRPGPSIPAELSRLEQEIQSGRAGPSQIAGGLRALEAARLQMTGRPGAVLEAENRISIALQNQGQQTLLKYLRGDEIPQQRSDFLVGETYFNSALQIDPEAWALRSRALFCRGRVLIFDKQYSKAVEVLERAVRIEPEAAYAWNALGIGYLENGDYSRAEQAFRDALRRAPRWPYPQHNLALTLAECGDYRSAEAAYRLAMETAPTAAYLRYNLGLLYQRTNRLRDAEEMFRQAIRLAPSAVDAYNALGFLKASTGKRKEAEALYRQALKLNDRFAAARHNLALLLAGDPKRITEALGLWRRNLLDDPAFLPSRLALAETYALHNNVTDAIEQYRLVIAARPAYVAGRISLANLLARSGRQSEAIPLLKEGLSTSPSNLALVEKLGDLLAAMGQSLEAQSYYRDALARTRDPGTRKRLAKKIVQ